MSFYGQCASSDLPDAIGDGISPAPLDFRPVDCLGDKALGLVSVAPASERYPLAPFEVLVVREEVLDLSPRDFRQVGVVPDMCVALR